LTQLADDVLRFILRWLPAAPARVLEVGCGDGALTRQLISSGFDAFGIDPDAPSGGCYERTRLEEFRPEGPFDAAVAVRSLHHVADLGRAVATLHSILPSRGRLVLFEFAVEHLDAAARGWLEDHGVAGALDHDYSGVIPLAELEQAVATGFRVVAREPAPYMAPQMERFDLVGAESDAIATGAIRPVGMRLAYERI
jgi:SAM-dependent methyltransferase